MTQPMTNPIPTLDRAEQRLRRAKYHLARSGPDTRGVFDAPDREAASAILHAIGDLEIALRYVLKMEAL